MAGWRSGNDIASGAVDLGLIPWTVKSDTVLSTARHRCDISSEFEAVSPRRYSKLRRWAPQLITCFGAIRRE